MYSQTPRTTFKIMDMSDAEDVLATLNFKHTAEIISFFSWPMTMDQAEMWCRKSEEGYATKTDFMFLVKEKEVNTPIGCIGIHFKEGNTQQAETGYWVAENFQRQGYASEMLQEIIRIAKDDLGLKKLFATTTFTNNASVGVLAKQKFAILGEKDVDMPDGSKRKSKLLELELN